MTCAALDVSCLLHVRSYFSPEISHYQLPVKHSLVYLLKIREGEFLGKKPESGIGLFKAAPELEQGTDYDLCMVEGKAVLRDISLRGLIIQLVGIIQPYLGNVLPAVIACKDKGIPPVILLQRDLIPFTAFFRSCFCILYNSPVAAGNYPASRVSAEL